MDQLREHKPNTNTDKDGVEDRPEAHDAADDRADARIKARKRVWWIVAWVGSVVATFVISNYSWEIIFLSSTSLLAGTFILFLSGIPFYHSKEFDGYQTQLTPRLKKLRYVTIPLPLSGISSVDLSHIKAIILIIMTLHACVFIRMDKGVIIESSNLRPEQQERASRLCNVTQVEESKTLLKMIPMWTTFLFLTSKKRASKAQLKLGKIIRIWSGMVLCTIFCVVAWLVKVHRLQIVDRKRSNPDKEISSLMQGSGTDGLEEFMIDELPKSLKIYASAINGFVIDGIGNFLGILYVNANIQLFSTTMNESRLDKYYLRLLILSFLNMCYYYPVSTIYRPIRHTQADMLERDITINHEV
ncbi:hypothetical protein ACOSQ3_006754 [Xanthoceras sorbifolium]